MPKRRAAAKRKPPSGKLAAAARGTALATVAHIDLVEDLLTRGYTARQARRHLQSAHNINHVHAGTIVAEVFKQWRGESDGESREDKRNHMRATLWGLYRSAVEKKYVAKNGKKYPAPDLRAAESIAKTLCMLDALLNQAVTTDGSEWRENALRILHLHYYRQEPPAIDTTGESVPEKPI